jgi:phosphate transport system substrate-binding protein
LNSINTSINEASFRAKATLCQRLGRLCIAVCALGSAANIVAAANLDSLPQYRPQQQVTGTLRSWGSPDMAGLLKDWEQGFREYHPEVRFADVLKGTETAQAALYTDVADFGLMDREILTLERHVMLRRRHGLPMEFAVATGGFAAANRSPALAVFVHKDNPLAKLTLQQLDGIFGEQRTGAWDDKFKWHPERARGPEGNIRTWGQLGLGGEWKDKAIQVYGYPITNYSPLPGPMLTFRRKVLSGSDMWNPNIREYEKGGDITAALAADKFGIAYGSLADESPNVKAVALAAAGSKHYVALTSETVKSQRYPLTRMIYVYVSPAKPLPTGVREFLRYVLSREGQEAVTREGGYFPLTPEQVRAELGKLD